MYMTLYYLFKPRKQLAALSCGIHVLSLKVRQVNFYHDGDTTPYGQIQHIVHITRCWDTLLENCAYHQWRARVDDFNK